MPHFWAFVARLGCDTVAEVEGLCFNSTKIFCNVKEEGDWLRKPV